MSILCPSPKKRRLVMGNFFLPMAVNVVHEEEIHDLKEVVDLKDEKVLCLSQEERPFSDVKVAQREFLLVDKMKKSEEGGTLAWEKHVVKQEIDLFQTLLCVEAIKLLEETFSTSLQSLATTELYIETALQLSPIMFETGKLLNHSLSEATVWSSLPFGVFCAGIDEIVNTLEKTSGEDRKLVTEVLDVAKPLLMASIKYGLDFVLENSEKNQITVDLITLSHVAAMREEKNFKKTVKEWAEYSVKRRERNTYSHPWILLDRAQREVYFRDLDRTLQDNFSANFRGIGYLAKLALVTKDKEDGARSRKHKEKKSLTFFRLIKKTREASDQRRSHEASEKEAEDEAMEASQFHNTFFD